MSTPILVIQNGKYKGRKVRLADGETVVGRGEEAKIRIASGEVSREHCILVPQAEGVLVRDLGSRNGSFVNGKPVAGEILLGPGETLTIGPMTFQLQGDVAVAKVARRAPKGDQGLSDDDIASLLSMDEKTSSTGSLSDTTIVPMGPGAADEGTAEIAPPTPPPAPKREFKSVAEEADDIIRRHFAAVGEERAARYRYNLKS